MGSSVHLCAVCSLWKTFESKMGITTITPKKIILAVSIFSANRNLLGIIYFYNSF